MSVPSDTTHLVAQQIKEVTVAHEGFDRNRVKPSGSFKVYPLGDYLLRRIGQTDQTLLIFLDAAHARAVHTSNPYNLTQPGMDRMLI